MLHVDKLVIEYPYADMARKVRALDAPYRDKKNLTFKCEMTNSYT